MNLEKKMGWAVVGAIMVLFLAACTPAAAPTPTPVKAPAAAPTAALPAATPASVAPAATPAPTKPAAAPTVAAATPAPTKPAAAPTAVVATPAPTKPAAAPTAAAAAATVAPTKPAAGAGDPVAGKAVFDSNCTACHPGGQQGAGPSLVGALGRIGEARVTSQIRNGGGIMPAYPASKISDAQMASLIAYLATLK